jgi:MioC protein
MMTGQAKPTDSFNFWNALSAWPFQLSKLRKTHDYTCYQNGSDYMFEAIEHGAQGYMTGQGKGVNPGEFIILNLEGSPHRYEVKAIDYYSSPSDMWVALLVRVV